MADATASVDDGFLDTICERADLNQYWFSKSTITAFVSEIMDSRGTAALVSSPSVYFSLPEEARKRCKVLDFDRQWDSDPGYVFYDFNVPLGFPDVLRAAFDFVLVDPPFITRDTWSKYAETALALLRPGGRLLCTTIAENAAMMQELLNVRPVLFRPSIPNLVYQYNVYTNYQSERLATLNSEVDDQDWRTDRADVSRPSDAQDVHQLQGERAITGRGSFDANLNAEEVVAAFLAAEASSGADVSETVLPRNATILSELRSYLGSLKRSSDGLRTQLIQASKRPLHRKSVEDALDNLEKLAFAALAWIDANSNEASEAINGAPVKLETLDVPAALQFISKARDSFLLGADACLELSENAKRLANRWSRSSAVLLERIKVLKRESTDIAGVTAS